MFRQRFSIDGTAYCLMSYWRGPKSLLLNENEKVAVAAARWGRVGGADYYQNWRWSSASFIFLAFRTTVISLEIWHNSLLCKYWWATWQTFEARRITKEGKIEGSRSLLSVRRNVSHRLVAGICLAKRWKGTAFASKMRLRLISWNVAGASSRTEDPDSFSSEGISGFVYTQL